MFGHELKNQVQKMLMLQDSWNSRVGRILLLFWTLMFLLDVFCFLKTDTDFDPHNLGVGP